MRPSRILPLLVLAACGTLTPARPPADAGSFRVTGVSASLDPTVRGPRLLPLAVDESQGYGTEAGGGVRAIVAGLRVVTYRDGAILVADDRLPLPPQMTTALPARLGGGFLFVLGSTIWRADEWRGLARPIFTSLHAIQSVFGGLDRVYARSQNATLAIDGKTGDVLDLGPWPASPSVVGYAAADGWRAVALTDLRGVVATVDAGATWRSLDLPMDPRQVIVSGDSLAIGGVENGKSETWFELRADGVLARMSAPPREAKGKALVSPVGPPVRPVFSGVFPTGLPLGGLGVPPLSLSTTPFAGAGPRTPITDSARDGDSQSLSLRIFGSRPLAAAIEDGWPLTDGTVVVARDGSLGRVRLADGALVEVVHQAFPQSSARCHPLSLTRASAPGAFGFVCGEPRGSTVIYAYDPRLGRLRELKGFDRPRVVLASGNGAVAIRGSCAANGDAGAPLPEPTRTTLEADAGGARAEVGSEHEAKDSTRPKPSAPEPHPYCILGHDDVWQELHVRGDASTERIVVLADGRVAVVSPPEGAVSARLTLLEKGRAVTSPVVFPPVPADVARVLRLGVWLDGFEERRPGVIGGWIEAGGIMLGIEIAIDGKATAGQFLRDAGLPFVSGKYGFGWTPSRRGFETTDGGMTWTALDLPEPLAVATKIDRRACGPVGCLASGWLRVGWGDPKVAPVPPAPPPYRAAVSVAPPQVMLGCEPTMPTMPAPVAPKRARAPEVAPSPSRRTLGSPPVLATPGALGVTSMPPFFALPGPELRDAERGMPFEVQELPDRFLRLGALARIYAWGPKTGDWDSQGRWQVKWLSPFAGWTESHASLAVVPGPLILDLTKAQGGSYWSSYSGLFQLASGDDPGHALLIARRMSRTEIAPIELDADRAPLEIRRADGEPFTELDGVTRAAGRWFLATPPPAGLGSTFTTLWQVDGSVARELLRVSRAALENGRPTPTRLARRSDGRAIGVVVDGQPGFERSTPTRWVLPVDLETGQRGEPEPLGYADLAGRTLEACTDDIVGWVFDTPLPAISVRVRLKQGVGSMHSVYARVRLTTGRACVERMAGIYDGPPPSLPAPTGARGGASAVPKAGGILASAFFGQARYALRCTLAK